MKIGDSVVENQIDCIVFIIIQHGIVKNIGKLCLECNGEQLYPLLLYTELVQDFHKQIQGVFKNYSRTKRIILKVNPV